MAGRTACPATRRQLGRFRARCLATTRYTNTSVPVSLMSRENGYFRSNTHIALPSGDPVFRFASPTEVAYM
ncbi:hypothetical protein GCM10022267_84160 [Lentzea roselyniae]|uniref:Uncharacterized protein n=1 Tax=Lentzea roselyniae TaxID=531940 RepID=A0ABP7C9M4_9PSEU